MSQTLRSLMNIKARFKILYRNMVFSLSARNSIFFTAFYRYFYRPSGNTFGSFACDYSKTRGMVTVVEVGANDGISNDPIHKFIKMDHWTGVLLEPQRGVFEKYLKPLYERTTGIIVVNAALDKSDGYKTLYKISFSESRWATGLSSFRKDVLETAISSGYVDREARKEGVKTPADKAEYISEEQVECLSAATLCKKYHLDNIDWLQIDTEGYDFEIIKMFDLDASKPGVIVYENLHLTSSLRDDCIAYLQQKGYLCRTWGPNTLAMRKPVTGFEKYFNVPGK